MSAAGESKGKAGGASARQDAKRRAHILYTGAVQGIDFRFTTDKLAEKFAVTGQVKNLADGRVELIVEGDREEVKKFLRAIEQSEVGALIQHESANWTAATGEFKDFMIAV